MRTDNDSRWLHLKDASANSTQSVNGAGFERILELSRFAAGRARGNTICVQQHREILKAGGDTASQLHELERWRDSSIFSNGERAALNLSESISLKQSTETSERALKEIRRYFNVAEIVTLSLAIVAVNDWVDLHSDAHMRVLIVEDNYSDQELLRRQLRKTQMEESVIFVRSSQQALVLLEGCRNRAFEWELIAIFLDLHLPGRSGIELLHDIRNISELEELPVIVMTSSANPRDIEECEKLQVTSYLQKPITFKSFSHALANTFHQSRTRVNRTGVG